MVSFNPAREAIIGQFLTGTHLRQRPLCGFIDDMFGLENDICSAGTLFSANSIGAISPRGS